MNPKKKKAKKDVTFAPRARGRVHCNKCKKTFGKDQIKTHEIMHSTVGRRTRIKKEKEGKEQSPKIIKRVLIYDNTYARCPECNEEHYVRPGGAGRVKCKRCNYEFIAYKNYWIN